MTKKVIISVICILVVFTSVVLYKFLNPKITKESVISEFNNNKEQFNIVKDYLLTKDDNYSIKVKTYKNEIENKNVKEAINYLVKKIGYKRMQNMHSSYNPQISKTVFFLRGGNDNDEFGIVYIGIEGAECGVSSEYLGDGWYFYWIGFDRVKY